VSAHQDAGVPPSRVRLPAEDWPDLLSFLCARFPHVAVSVWRARFAEGRVLDADGAPLDLATPYRPGQWVTYTRALPPEPVIPFEATVLHIDDHLLVVDKPPFLPVMPVGPYVQQSLWVRLQRQLGREDLVPLHRIDRETAGLVLFSLHPASRAAYQALFRERRIRKTYEALAPRLPPGRLPRVYRSRIARGEDFPRMRELPGPPNSETRLRVLEQDGEWARYLLQPLSGRTHQLRIHLAAMGAPIRHDPLYPRRRERAPGDYSAPLQLLARGLRFIDPINGMPRRFRSLRRLEPL
jgi:tRNA pseudouridine32 synthase / 23S rRNA pseudouridine746 synthase